MRGLISLAVVGCAASPELRYSDVEASMAGCVACHGPDRTEAELDLTDFHAATVGVPSTQADLWLIEPGDYLSSYLWHKCNESQLLAGGAGSSMPLGGSLTEDQLIDLAVWIDAGAFP